MTPEDLAYADWIAANIDEFEEKAKEFGVTLAYYIMEFV